MVNKSKTNSHRTYCAFGLNNLIFLLRIQFAFNLLYVYVFQNSLNFTNITIVKKNSIEDYTNPSRIAQSL